MSNAFKRGFNAGGSRTTTKSFDDDVRLFKPGVNHTLIKSFLVKTGSTNMRILPSINEQGIEDIALNPAATKDTEEEDLYGPFAANIEIVQGIGNKSFTYASGSFEDRAGNIVDEGWSVTKTVVHRILYKLLDSIALSKAGEPTDIPPSWKQWMEGVHGSNFRKFRLKMPTQLLCFQVIASSVDGVPCVDSRGVACWSGPHVFSVPRSAIALFHENLSTRIDETKDLSMDNNLMGDICSLSGGRNMMLRKIVGQGTKDGEDGQAVYNLMPVGPAFPLSAEYVQTMFKPWEDIIDLVTIEDAVEMLVATFDGIAVDYALRDTGYSEYIPDLYKGTSSGMERSMNRADREAYLAARGIRSTGSAAAVAAAPSLPSAPADLMPATPPALSAAQAAPPMPGNSTQLAAPPAPTVPAAPPAPPVVGTAPAQGGPVNVDGASVSVPDHDGFHKALEAARSKQ